MIEITPSKNRGSIKAFKAARAVSGKKFNNNAEPQPADARKASRAIFKGGNKQKGEMEIIVDTNMIICAPNKQ